MRNILIGRATSRSFTWLQRLLADRRGSGDVTTYVLLTAAGAAMVALTVPSLFSSSQSAASTFQNQVNVLERGAGGTGGASGSSGGSAGGNSGWTLNVSANGVSASGPGGSVSAGSSGVSGSVGQGAGGGGNAPAGGGSGASLGSANNQLNPSANNPINGQTPAQALAGAIVQ
jgi:hypothetical protein